MATSAKAVRSTRTRRLRLHLGFLRVPIAVVLMALYFLPIYWMIKTSFQPEAEISGSSLNLWLSTVSLENYARVLSDVNLPFWFRNSFILATSTMLVSMLVSTLAGYTLARSRFWAVRSMGKPYLLAYIVPSVMIVVPIFVMFAGIGWHNTFQALIISYATFAVPFSTWLLRAYFMTLPVELEDAALVDGCTRLGALFRVMLPLAAPGVATAGLFSFVLAWNEFLFAFVFIFSEEMKPLSVALQRILSQTLTASSADLGYYGFGDMFALCTLVAAPVLIVFLFLQNWLVRGLAAGAVKG